MKMGLSGDCVGVAAVWGAAVRFGAAVLVLGAVTLMGCDEPDPVLLLTVSAETRVESYDLVVVDRENRQVVLRRIGEPVDSDNPLRDISEPGQALRLALDFDRPGRYLVHMVGRSMSATQIATKVLEIKGLVRRSVTLISLEGLDVDGDGFLSREACQLLESPNMDCEENDCDDGDPTVNPLAVDVCGNGLDEDCDGLDRPCVDADFDGSPVGEDCDDNDPQRFPGNPEGPNLCPSAKHPFGLLEARCDDGIDQDCDGVDPICEVDADCDGSPAREDCDESNPDIHPGAVEVCGNGIDENCIDGPDDGCLSCDLDGDGFQRDDPATGCPTMDYPADLEIDCDDNDAGVFPGITDLCGGMEGGSAPCAAYHLCDGRDNDCDQEVDEGCPDPACDVDADGFMPAGACNPPVGQEDCDDNDAMIYPGAPDICGDMVAQNCNADLPCEGDLDSDGYDSTTDCDENNDAVNPGATEVCNGIDDDCDGLIDEGNPDVLGNPIGDQYCNDSSFGLCADPAGAGRCICSRLTASSAPLPADRVMCAGEDLAASASPRCFFAPQPEPEQCDTVDHDCNGVSDAPDGDNLLELGDPCAPDQGVCVAGTVLGCDLTHETDGLINIHFVCSADTVGPQPEQCNGFDDNCNGVVPLRELDPDGDGLMVCSGCAGLALASGIVGCNDCAADDGNQGECLGATPDCCYEQCVDLQSNFSHCGTCDHACSTFRATTCQGGQCLCGGEPECGAGTRCDADECVCDKSSCPLGCCEAGVCYSPPSAHHCEVLGKACTDCGSQSLCNPLNGKCL